MSNPNLVTVEEVAQYTGVSLNAAAIFRAQVVIEAITGRSMTPAKPFGAGDTRRLKQAVAFQAAYMDAHPEIFQTMDVANMSQEGLSVGFRGTGAHAVAPLASLALSRLTWKRSRSVSMVSTLFPLQDFSSDVGNWKPLRRYR